MKSVVVVGAQWGDEGKGKVVDYLAGSFDYIARVAGGHLALGSHGPEAMCARNRAPHHDRARRGLRGALACRRVLLCDRPATRGRRGRSTVTLTEYMRRIGLLGILAIVLPVALLGSSIAWFCWLRGNPPPREEPLGTCGCRYARGDSDERCPTTRAECDEIARRPGGDGRSCTWSSRPSIDASTPATSTWVGP